MSGFSYQRLRWWGWLGGGGGCGGAVFLAWIPLWGKSIFKEIVNWGNQSPQLNDFLADMR